MASNGEDKERALAAAGHTGPLGTLLLCLVLGGLGALLGSIVVAMLMSAVFPSNSEAENVVLGMAAGAALGVFIALAKVRQGNRDAREEVEDRQWRRLARRTDFDRPQ